MTDNCSFYIKPWHFLLAIVIFFALIGIIARKEAQDAPFMKKGISHFTELQNVDPDGVGITCVFFTAKTLNCVEECDTI